MAKNRWDMGKPSLGDAFDPGFISPLTVKTGHGDYEDIATIPFNTPPATMEGQMDGDEHTTAGNKRGKKR
jgi:hypothetical protein